MSTVAIRLAQVLWWLGAVLAASIALLACAWAVKDPPSGLRLLPLLMGSAATLAALFWAACYVAGGTFWRPPLRDGIDGVKAAGSGARRALSVVGRVMLFFPAWYVAAALYTYGGPPVAALAFAAILGLPYYWPFLKLFVQQLLDRQRQ